MSRLDKFEEILKSYEGKASGASEETVLFNGELLLRSEYEALEKIIESAGIKDLLMQSVFNRIVIENQRVKSFNLGGMPLKYIADDIKELKNLQSLNCRVCELTSLPDALLELSQLSTLVCDTAHREDPVAKKLEAKGITLSY